MTAGSFASVHAQELKSLNLLAPSSAGSGYDQLARTIQGILQAQKLTGPVEVQNVAGGGGTVGLSQFVTTRPRHPSALVIGFALVGGVLTTKSAVTLDQATPVARLMGEADAIVVPASSDIKSMADLVSRLKADPSKVSWAGGSIGGVDHIAAGLIVKAVGSDPKKMNFVVHAGGGEVLASTLGGHATVGISGYEEFRAQVDAGALRALAVTGDERIAGVDVPTLKESGVELSVLNWRGVMAHPKMKDDERAELEKVLAELVKTPQWKEALAKRGWIDTYLPAKEFGEFLAEEQKRVETALKEVGLL
ncbi:tripartite tricarboxylate transporter substrate binding protein [Agrobacterium tumefaciens]|uniref:Tripartite tricarboxylate transporter substrate binding protein n=2 Tax=Agrobacterium tumefaciens TaxID=358 RepID=A0AA44F693_AGRTU|nr:tripartite tricarboxylate transporter substrate-binding protein [Agrobacterium tumefaciens]NTB87556.1 tripartite tricarboxylate transporter substrate binding protein [Agrobacterium tumefaciens]NTC19749.1 tripartite tricarboxylate transporter substrate binding protein [Agrobacterium tumefaciens]NTC29677.1 tripartite tricarboxylate transporter substrate binding protein [Agrobacterium tumefaciens]